MFDLSFSRKKNKSVLLKLSRAHDAENWSNFSNVVSVIAAMGVDKGGDTEEEWKKVRGFRLRF